MLSPPGLTLTALVVAAAAIACEVPAPALDGEPAASIEARSLLPVQVAGPRAASAGKTALRRHDIDVLDGDLVAAFSRAGLAEAHVAALDAAFVERVDLHAHLAPGTRATLWTSGHALVAARVPMRGRSALLAARRNGAADAPWFDERGLSLDGPIRARPLSIAAVTSPFGARLHPVTRRHARHDGVDYAAPEGTAVPAVADGVVRERGRSPHGGRYVVLDHVDGYESRYLHLHAIAARLRVGDRVQQGDVIGLVGSTGRATGPHLHFELRLAGIALDPLAILPIPSTALGTRALQAHRAFLAALP